MRIVDAQSPPDFLTVPEAAAWLRIGRNQCYQAIARGEIPAIRLGRSVRIPRAALLRFIDSPGVSSSALGSSSGLAARSPATTSPEEPIP